MKQIKYIFGLILAGFIQTTYAYDFQSDGIYYTILSETNQTVEVSYNSDARYSSNLVIPAEVTKYGQTYKVVRIGENAFLDDKRIYNLYLPETIDSINNSAFVWCESLQNIIVDENNQYYSSENGVLYNKKKTILVHYPNSRGEEFTIPNGVEVIASKAFGTNTNLISILFSETVKRVEDNAFEVCYANEIILNEGLEYIGNYAFASCNFTSIGLPTTLKYIGKSAFTNDQWLWSIYIPSSVEYIDDNNVFAGCTRLTKIEVDEGNPYYCSIDGILYNKSKTLVYCCPQNNANIEWVELPSTITRIAECAFHTVKSLTRIVIPSGVTEIGNGAFYYCENINRVTILAKEPPSTPYGNYYTSDPWDYSGRAGATLYVPKGCSDKYYNFSNKSFHYGVVYPYRKFKNIVELEEEASIYDIIKDEEKDNTIYTLSGIKTMKPQNGINIIKSKSGIKKMFSNSIEH